MSESTILNCFIGSVEFQSDESKNGQKNYKLRASQHNGTFVMDTPGLKKAKTRKESASDMTLPLKRNGEYKIFLLCAYKSGSLRSADLVLIRIVLNNVPDITSYPM